jgi:hypothetical protein
MSEIKLSREEERAIDQKLGPDFKKRMNKFADKLGDLMLKFPMVQGHCKEADYLRQPFMMMSGALHLVKRFGMTEEERDKDDELIAEIPAVLDALANGFEKGKEVK